MSRRLIWDTFTRSLWVRAVALALVTALVVVQCGREGGTARSLSNLNYDSLPAKAPRPTKPAERLHADVTELKDLLAIQSKRDLSGDQADKARSARRRIATELGAIHRQFADDRAKLQKLDAKAALKRLDNIESRTTKLALTLNTALARIPDDGPRATVPAGDAVDALTALSPDKPEQPLSSASDFGFGLDKAKPRSPELSAGITPAYGSPTPTDVASELPRTPEQEDLAATPETKATPAIQDLAGRLDHDPVKIYEYVRNEIRYETYYGLRKGADQTLAEKSGSDADQAALLIALLRESGVHARFVQGVTQLPIDTAANWLGVDVQSGERIESVPQILTSSGIPTTQIRANGQLTKIRFDHFWVEAYVSTQTYRGIDEQIGKKQWLPLDASIKPTVIKRPTADFRALMEPIAKGLAQDLVAATHAQGDAIVQPDRNALDAIRQKSTDRLQSLMRDEGVTSRQPGSDILGGTEIRRTSASYLPASLPAQVLAVSAEARAVPASLQSRVTFSVSGSDPLSLPEPDTDPGAGGLTFTAPTSELANKRITLA
ncbi:MAG: hypothetical protein QOJ29_1439, partial [Thermoleophilaceae bacterium]|nr:hypothetical protein [Thermoleophilaceae bacterium]